MIAFPTDPFPPRPSVALAEPAADAYRVASDIVADLSDDNVRALRLLDALWGIEHRVAGSAASSETRGRA